MNTSAGGSVLHDHPQALVVDVANDPLDHRCLSFSDDLTPTYEKEGLATRYAIRLAHTDRSPQGSHPLDAKALEWRGYSTDIVREDPPA